MHVTAHLRYLRMSPRKVRLVTDLVKGMDVSEADAQLAHRSRAAVAPLRKLLHSAIANAEHNFKLQAGNLFVQEITVNQGPTLKRFRARAFGRAATIRKRSSHVTVVLGERVPTVATSHQPPATSPVPPPVVSERPKVAREPTHAHGGADVTPGQRVEEKEPFDVRRKGKHRHRQHQDARSGKRPGGFFKRLFTRRLGER